MALPTTPTSELEAVNLMLGTIGESPVNSLEVSGVVDAVTARTILGDASRAVQSEGWSFNTDKGFPLLVQAFSPFYVYVPGNAMQVDTTQEDMSLDLVVRGNRLWDRRNHTFSFEGRAKVRCDIVWLLPFDELPEPARHYIVTVAARRFQDGAVGNDAIHAYTEADERRARWAMKKFEAKSADRNLLTGSYAVGRILDRTPR